MSTLPDVLRAVRAILADKDPTTEILCGERYLQQEGAANRVLFVIVDGDWTGAPKLGAKLIGGFNEGCQVYIWGSESTDDFDRYNAANVLRRRVVNALHRVAPGRIEPGAVTRLRDSNVITYGEEYSLAFTYLENVPEDKTIAKLPPAGGEPTSPPNPLRPPGTPASTAVINVSTLPED